MTPAQSPLRLSALGSSAPPSLRSALSAAARHQPRSEELAQLALSLSPLLSAPPLPNAGAPSSSHPVDPSAGAPLSGAQWSGTGWTMGKGAIFLAGIAALLLSLPRIWSATRPSNRPTLEMPAIAASPTPEPVGQQQEAPVPPSVERESTASVSQPSDAAREPRTKPRTLSAPTGGALSTTTAAAPAPGTQESEVQLLERARRLLQTNPRQALDLVREHERRFVSGALVQEREIVAIDALERLGRSDDARSRDESFRARYPSSVHGKRVEVPSGRP